jgi:hypothetical protein
MASLADRLRAYWLSIGAKLRQPASPEEIRAFETRYGVHVPRDLRDYFLIVNGLEEGEWDGEMIEWYPLQKWRNLIESGWALEGLPNPESYFLFADYCLDAFGYAIRLYSSTTDRNPVICVDAHEPPLAQSFSELIEAYLANPSVLLL